MTDTAFVPTQMQVADAADQDPEGPSRDNRRLLLMVGGAAVAVVLAIVAWLLLFSGGDSSTDATGPAPSVAAPAVPQDNAAPDTPAKQPVISKAARHAFRDPFKALVAPASATGGSTTGSTTGDTTTTGGSTATAGDTSGGTTTGTTGPSASAAHKFQVVKVYSSNTKVDVKLDGKTYKGLQAGEVFAKIFKVRFIGGAVNSFQIGDEVFNVAGNKAVTVST